MFLFSDVVAFFEEHHISVTSFLLSSDNKRISTFIKLKGQRLYDLLKDPNPLKKVGEMTSQQKQTFRLS